MTNEEAIKELTHELRIWESECKSVHPMKDALRLAIEALRQPPNDDWERYSDFLWKEAYERGKQETLSAEAKPTVVRCKTMIPYGDFREWAKLIREDNQNVIVIPCDAEVVSADAVSREPLDIFAHLVEDKIGYPINDITDEGEEK